MIKVGPKRLVGVVKARGGMKARSRLAREIERILLTSSIRCFRLCSTLFKCSLRDMKGTSLDLSLCDVAISNSDAETGVDMDIILNNVLKPQQ
jgi:hypothetical protein